MLCGETVAVCCENRTEHTDTLCGQNAEFSYTYFKADGTYTNTEILRVNISSHLRVHIVFFFCLSHFPTKLLPAFLEFTERRPLPSQVPSLPTAGQSCGHFFT
jgi:hypothetical protein